MAQQPPEDNGSRWVSWRAWAEHNAEIDRQLSGVGIKIDQFMQALLGDPRFPGTGELAAIRKAISDIQTQLTNYPASQSLKANATRWQRLMTGLGYAVIYGALPILVGFVVWLATHQSAVPPK